RRRGCRAEAVKKDDMLTKEVLLKLLEDPDVITLEDLIERSRAGVGYVYTLLKKDLKGRFIDGIKQEYYGQLVEEILAVVRRMSRAGALYITTPDMAFFLCGFENDVKRITKILRTLADHVYCPHGRRCLFFFKSPEKFPDKEPILLRKVLCRKR
ncbi:MAG: hypothetical protein ACK4SY_10590, partial [Pyrobaculum sp.]